MKILHITNSAFSLPYFLGDQIGFFKERDHDVEVCCPPSKDFKDFTNLHDIRGYEIMLSRRYSILSDLRAFLSLVSIIKEQKYDCVVGHTPKGALLAMLASYVVKVRVRLYFRHGIVYINQFGLPRYVLKSIERLTSFLSTDVICVSNYLVELSLRDRLSLRSKTHLIGNGSCNGLDVQNKFNPRKILEAKRIALKTRLGFTSDNIVIGYVGRMAKDKGISELVDSFHILHHKNPKVRLLLIGPEDDRDGLDNRIFEQIRKSDLICWEGHIKVDLEYYYSVMDIFTLPTKREGLGTVLLEASAMELPVVTNGATGSRDAVLDGRTGFTTKIDVNSLVEVLSRYCELPSLIESHGKAGREFMLQSFDQNNFWYRLEKFYSQRM